MGTNSVFTGPGNKTLTSMVAAGENGEVICLLKKNESMSAVSCFACCLPLWQLVVPTNLFSIVVGHMLTVLGMEPLEIRWNLSLRNELQ